MRIQHLHLLLIILLSMQCATISHNSTLTSEEQKQDYDLMVDILNEACPVLTTYKSDDEVDDHFERVRRKLNKPNSVFHFYIEVARTLAYFQDGHLQSYASNDFYASVNSLECFLPLRLHFLNEKLYIKQNLSDSEILKGEMEIIAINGKRTTKILEDLYALVSSDMDNRYFKNHKLNNEYRLYLAYYFNFPTEYTIQVRDVERPIKLQAISGKTHRELTEKLTTSTQKKRKSLYSIDYDENNSTAIFRFSTFGDREGEEKLRTILDELVSQCKEKNITDLILDIRGNTGGFDGNAAIIYSYLTQSTFQPLKGRFLKINRISFLEHVLNKDLQETLQKVPLQKSGNEYKLNMELDQLFKPNENNYDGRVYLLTDGSTFSAAGLFVSIFLNNKRGSILGSNTGGGYRGDSGGVAYVELPNSKIVLFLPLVRNEYFYDNKRSWDSFVPDKKINLTISNVLGGEDPVLSQTYKLIIQEQANDR